MIAVFGVFVEMMSKVVVRSNSHYRFTLGSVGILVSCLGGDSAGLPCRRGRMGQGAIRARIDWGKVGFG